jgi:hypothetical protein
LIKIFAWFRKYLVVWVVLVVLGAVLCLATKGCEYFPESTFQLASESRMPKWITLPQGITRADVSITMSYYSFNPWGGSAEFTVEDANKRRIEKINGNERCDGFELRNPPPGFPHGYPFYMPVTVGGLTEIIEHKKMEPIFYVTDDPAVWKQYRANGCH